jgi:hypothetical protein
MWGEFEFFDPVGDLVASEFDHVDEDTITLPDEFR